MPTPDRSQGRVYRDGKPVPQRQPVFDAIARRRFKALANFVVFIAGLALIALLLWPELGPIVAWWSR